MEKQDRYEPLALNLFILHSCCFVWEERKKRGETSRADVEMNGRLVVALKMTGAAAGKAT